MHQKNLNRSLLLVVFSALFVASCSIVQTGNIVGPNDKPKTDAPYSNAEPEKYQTEIWQTTAGGTEKFFAARNGDKWRIDSAYGAPDQVTSLHTDKDYVLSFATKVYAEYPVGHGFDERQGMVDEISMGMLNSKAKGSFEKTKSDGGLTIYRVVSDVDKGKESTITFDERLGLPVKKEIYKANEAGRTVDMTVTLSGFKTDVDDGLFVLPKGFKKVSIEEMKKTLSTIKQ